jgi:Ras-related protein Rab-1A
MNMKLIFIGDPAVGKTSLLTRLMDDDYSENNPSTVNMDFRFKDYKLNEHTVKLQVWDTAGQERYRSLINSYYRHSQGIIMVFDLTDKNSFESILTQWLPIMIAHLGSIIPKFLILGNKKDLSQDHENVITSQYAKVRIEQVPDACFRDADINDGFQYMDSPQQISYNFNGCNEI